MHPNKVVLFCRNAALSLGVSSGVALLLLLAGGCASKGKGGDVVSGKVTVNGQPVQGEVVFLGEGGKQARTLTNAEGGYVIENPPKGELTILVRAVSIGAPPPPPKDVARAGMDTMAVSPGTVSPPRKYAQPNNGLPKFTVTGGKQTHDVTLTP